MRAATVPSRGAVRARLSVDRLSIALGVVFVLAAAFYLWTAATTEPLALHGEEADAYNRLAVAFLHLHLWVMKAPPELLSLSNPYSQAQNIAIQSRFDIHDYALYDGRLYLTWGPGPVLVLLIPLHLLGFSPSPSVTASLFAIGGLGFALATLRVILRQLGGAPLWMSLLAACALALSSVVPFILRVPLVYEEAIAGGYCFAMAGVWLAASALVDRRASLWRLALMSLAFGLATASRPTLGLLALLLVPVYLSLRATRRAVACWLRSRCRLARAWRCWRSTTRRASTRRWNSAPAISWRPTNRVRRRLASSATCRRARGSTSPRHRGRRCSFRFSASHRHLCRIPAARPRTMYPN